MSECLHKNVQFIGMYSLLGNYLCQDCGTIIPPVDYHRMMGYIHVDLVDYYRENPDKLHPSWRS